MAIVNKNPPTLITIGITAYNSSDTIKSAVQSALEQSWKNTEIIVIDDMSSDDTWLILKNLQKDHPKIEIFRNSENLGVGFSRNQIIKHAKGGYIAFFDSDDYSTPERVSEQYARIVDYERKFSISDIVICHTSRSAYYPDGSVIIQPTMGCNAKVIAPNGKAVAKRVLLGAYLKDGTGACPTCCQMGSKKTYIAVGGFDESFRRHEDTEFVVRVALAGGHFLGIDKALVTQNMVLGKKSLDEEFKLHRRVLEKHRPFIEAEGSFLFCELWLKMKYGYLSRDLSVVATMGLLMVLFPIRSLSRLIIASKNIEILRHFQRFHASDL